MSRKMMSTQSYYGPSEHDAYHLTPRRSVSTSGYYERLTPYANYHDQPRQDLRTEYAGRAHLRAMVIQEPDSDIGPGGNRRRIAVACTRCRRRKIKCSGDPGDGSGCQACRGSSVADLQSCNFIRVGSSEVPLQPESLAHTMPYDTCAPASSHGPADSAVVLPFARSRPSLPALHTRQTFPSSGYDQYDSSPVDPYSSYGTSASSALSHRQDSLTNGSYGSLENYRYWPTPASASMPTPGAPPYYDSQPQYSFGNLQTSAYPQTSNNTRLPSVTAADSISSLNMGSLHSSLPTQTVQERTLPVPYTHYPPTPSPYSGAEYSELRPLASFTEPQQRMHINGIHSRTALPWSTDSAPATSRTATSQVNHMQIGSLPLPPPAPQTSATPVSESTVLGYQFSANNMRTAESPQVSPTAAASLSEGFSGTTSTTTQLHAGNIRYLNEPVTRMLPHEQQRSSPAQRQSAELYSFSTDTGERPMTSVEQAPITAHNYAQMRAPQPQHAVSVETLRRQSPFDQQRSGTAHRMSLSNLNSRY